MLDNILAVFAFAVFLAFLGILFIWVPRIDLGVVLAITLGLAFVDFFIKREKKN